MATRSGSLVLILLLLFASLACAESQEARNHYNRGVIFQSQGKAMEAISEYREAIALDPLYGWAWSNLGNVWLSLGKVAEAVECFRKAIEIDQTDASFHNNLGYAYSRQGKAELALSEYEKALGLYPDYAAALFNLACLHSLKGNLDLALSLLQKAMERGFADLDFIEKEPDLANLRNDPRYHQLLIRHRREGTQ
jgi:tetratricopeptide (TPR) repeat protein